MEAWCFWEPNKHSTTSTSSGFCVPWKKSALNQLEVLLPVQRDNYWEERKVSWSPVYTQALSKTRVVFDAKLCQLLDWILLLWKNSSPTHWKIVLSPNCCKMQGLIWNGFLGGFGSLHNGYGAFLQPFTESALPWYGQISLLCRLPQIWPISNQYSICQPLQLQQQCLQRPHGCGWVRKVCERQQIWT